MKPEIKKYSSELPKKFHGQYLNDLDRGQHRLTHTAALLMYFHSEQDKQPYYLWARDLFDDADVSVTEMPSAYASLFNQNAQKYSSRLKRKCSSLERQNKALEAEVEAQRKDILELERRLDNE